MFFKYSICVHCATFLWYWEATNSSESEFKLILFFLKSSLKKQACQVYAKRTMVFICTVGLLIWGRRSAIKPGIGNHFHNQKHSGNCRSNKDKGILCVITLWCPRLAECDSPKEQVGREMIVRKVFQCSHWPGHIQHRLSKLLRAIPTPCTTPSPC